MHSHTLNDWRHEHVFLGHAHDRNERRTWLVVGLTAAMMVGEIAGGALFGSMALTADGWHMATHVAALGIAAFAYRYASRHARDPRFAFGTGKLGDLAGFASAIILAIVALGIGLESLLRLFQPVSIQYREAIPIAVLGLAVNLASVWLLGGHQHEHDDDHDHHDHHHHDHNMRSAYWHVLADALTSLLAIGGLLMARALGWSWLDPAIGLAGALVIANWSRGLLRDAGAVLLDATPRTELADAIRRRLERGEDRIADLHVWRLGPGHNGAIVSLVSHDPQPVEHYKALLHDVPALSHVTVELHRCAGDHE
ncbi:MAG TPA: CDF family Co(II)/Ni(II) efflux transporter DmeF [Reyranella sp.]|nr:CDF family Co(II)/Ni(II) efflux transporter DmeF [Reyranella sp.]